MRRLVVRAGRVIDPARGVDGRGDVVIADGRIAAVEMDRPAAAAEGDRVVDAAGCWVTPGLIDLHAHLREPGAEGKEDIRSGTAAAAAGGFTAICAMPNTHPVNDSPAMTEYVLARARAAASVRVYPIAAITVGQEGQTLTEMHALKAAGAVAVSDDGHAVADAGLMRRALEYARTVGLVVIQHAEDPALAAGGLMHEGTVATRMGVAGVPRAAEEVLVARDLILAEMTGARYHVAHVSSAGTVRLLAEARARGVQATAEVTPHHLWLTDEDVLGYRTECRVNPPLREASDREALRRALRERTIDAIATDHAPHGALDKECEFDRALPGLPGFETALGLSLRLVAEGLLSAPQLVDALSATPARILSLPGGSLEPGSVGDVTVIDPAVSWTVDASAFRSKARYTPFDGWPMKGRAAYTIVAGEILYEAAGR